MKRPWLSELMKVAGIAPASDPYGIDAALADRKANRSLYQALERSERTRKGNNTRAQRKAGVA